MTADSMVIFMDEYLDPPPAICTSCQLPVGEGDCAGCAFAWLEAGDAGNESSCVVTR